MTRWGSSSASRWGRWLPESVHSIKCSGTSHCIHVHFPAIARRSWGGCDRGRKGGKVRQYLSVLFLHRGTCCDSSVTSKINKPWSYGFRSFKGYLVPPPRPPGSGFTTSEYWCVPYVVPNMLISRLLAQKSWCSQVAVRGQGSPSLMSSAANQAGPGVFSSHAGKLRLWLCSWARSRQWKSCCRRKKSAHLSQAQGEAGKMLRGGG